MSSPNLDVPARSADRRTLDAIFRHPLAHNLPWREVVSLFSAIGGADQKANGDLALCAGAEHLSLKRPHKKDLTATEVMDIRHFLIRAGWSSSVTASHDAGSPAPEPSLIVIIDHAGAKVYRSDRSYDEAFGTAAERPLHVHHHPERMTDDDRDETYPADQRFFETVAAALSSGGKIVLISHGKGQSNEAAHLSAHLMAHDKATYARIVSDIVADLQHLTTRELLELGSEALDQSSSHGSLLRPEKLATY